MIDFHADPLFWQRFLKSAGFYQGDLDGDFGPKNMQAVREDHLKEIAAKFEQGEAFV